ncbi:DUF6090 family protein [Kangiella sp. TOML190]|uniref:DUF6090 family protein n=1 Tax=Kangiella sp. TOML190 TaxID=2931351 RepID=UPI00203ECC1E|nr:DUF6090 family protein [Kangiella sp. TOML190]
MLLRRVTQHVKAQNWFAVFVDFVIVVVGVFIGIQVANWNEQIAGEKRAKVLLKRTYNDLNNDIEVFKAELDYLTVVRQYAMTAVNRLNNKQAIDDEQLVIAIYQATQINGVWSNRATYNEMLSTGDINLIQDEKLKSLIFGYYSVDFATNEFLTARAPYRELVRSHMPVTIQDSIKNLCGDQLISTTNNFSATLPETCDIPHTQEEIKHATEQMRKLPNLLSSLRLQIAINDTKVFNLKLFLNQAEQLMESIRKNS